LARLPCPLPALLKERHPQQQPKIMRCITSCYAPVYLDGNKLNLNIGGGAEFFYTYNSLLRVSGGYHFAYLDNLTNGDDTKAPSSYSDWQEYGTALKPTKSKRFGLMVSPTLVSWERDANYHITLGSAGYRTVAVTRVNGKILRSITGRFGYQVDDRIIQDKDGLPFKNTTPEYVYHYQGDSYTLTPSKLSFSSTRIRAEMAVIGVGLTTFRDVKITLDDDQYKGRREEKAQIDFFVDLLYAHKLSLQDMLYYHSLDFVTDEGRHLAQRLNLSTTPVSKTGVRIGYQVLTMYRKNFGTKFLLEGGVRPGIKADTKNANMYAQFTIGLIFGGRMALELKDDE
jgi:hypothetical protein